MVWRILFVLFKSSLMVAFFELLRPVSYAIGLQLTFVATIASAVSRATAIPYGKAEVLVLIVLATMLLEIPSFIWKRIA